MRTKIVVTDKVDPILVNNLKGSGFEVDYFPEITHDDLLKIVGDYNAIVVRSRTKFTPDLIKKPSNLKLVARAGVGLDGIAVDDLKAANISVVSAPEASTESVTELTTGMMICAARNIRNLSLETRNMKFRKRSRHRTEGKDSRYYWIRQDRFQGRSGRSTFDAIQLVPPKNGSITFFNSNKYSDEV